MLRFVMKNSIFTHYVSALLWFWVVGVKYKDLCLLAIETLNIILPSPSSNTISCLVYLRVC